MKKYKFLSVVIALCGMFLMSSCGDDFLTTESASRVPSAAGQPADEDAIFSALVAAYNILLHDDYSDGYNSVILMADLRSDDLYKGGESAGDQQQLYNLATYTSTPSNNIAGMWNLNYYGIAKANNAILYCDNAIESVDKALVERYRAEALLLRVYYYHILWKNWGNIPYFRVALEEPFVSPQYKADEVYQMMMEDLTEAEKYIGRLPWRTNNYGEKSEMGRLNKGFLYMLKARIVLYQKDTSKYAEIASDMENIIKNGSYDLYSDFDKMWENEGEFCIENIFEVNLMPGGAGNWDGRNGYGTNLPRFISPSELSDPSGIFSGGWGFGPVRPSIWENLWESGDVRKLASVNDWRPETGAAYNGRFQDTGFYQRKYAARVGYNPFGTTDLNFGNNLRLFRYAETLLNYAELAISGQGDKTLGKQCLDKIRQRAGVAAVELTLDNVKKERHREFVGEGMRFWDLIRWGDAAKTLTESITERTPAGGTWSWSRTFTEQKKYLPIPEEEINVTKGTAYPLEQNPGW